MPLHNTLYILPPLYLVAINLAGLVIMLHDKRAAKLGRRRTPERTIMTIAVLGGSLGVWAGMYILRHKTLHLKFTLGLPAIVVAQVALLIYLTTIF